VPELLARTDHDFTLAEPRQRRRAAAKAPTRPPFALLGLLWRHPGRSFAVLAGTAFTMGFLFNALVLQAGPHPAPLFGPAPAPVVAVRPPAVLLPPARPPELGPLEPSRPAAPPQPPPVSRVEKAQPPAALAPPVDPIGDVIRSGGVRAEAKLPPEPSRQVLAAQRALNRLGFGPVKPDGVMGAGTRAAIEKFEKSRGLPVTGELGGKTARELVAAVGGQLD
jgi:hypothetical protein